MDNPLREQTNTILPSRRPGAGTAWAWLLAGLLCATLATPAAADTLTALAPIPSSADTSHKPQSKVWQHANTWWAVAPTTSVVPGGMWLWRLEANNTWTNVLHLSSQTVAYADAKSDGDVTHVLIYSDSPELVSVEYVAGPNTYQLWTSRPTATAIPFGAGDFAATTIDIDSTGRMWLATEGQLEVKVHYSDPPYASFSGAIVLGSAAGGDMSAVTALPNNTIGVFWSDQITQRFGFRIHEDGADPNVWLADEVPASQSAMNVVDGMADDHMNFAVASDGTLYVAVKTSYDTPGVVAMALLVRRLVDGGPGGVWDDLHEVSTGGNTPIVLLNEVLGTVRVMYHGGGGVVFRESSLSNISFGSSQLVIPDSGRPTSTKQNWTDEVVVLGWNKDTLEMTGVKIALDIECTGALECDDGNACTDDVCNGGVCENPLVFDGTVCDDGLSCTSGDICTVGVCGGSDDCPAGQSCDGGSGVCEANLPPEGSIDAPAGPLTITQGQSVLFAGSGTDPENDLPLSYLWDFEESSSGVAPSTLEDPGPVTFPVVGTFTVSLRVADSLSLADPTPATVVVTVETPGPITGPDVAHWNLDEGLGSTATDISGNGHTGNVLGPLWVTDTPSGGGSALSFDGVDDYVDVGEVGVVGEALTIALWFKADSFAASDGRLISRATGSSSKRHHWMLSTTSSAGTKLRFRLRTDGSTSTLIAGSGNLAAGVWTHAAVVYDGATMRIYKDGVEVGSLPKTGLLTNDPGVLTAIGNQPLGAGSAPFHGAIDDVRIYQQALTQAEVAALASGANQPPVAADDAYVLDQDSSLAIDAGSGVLANDTDPEDDPLTVVLVDDVAFGTLLLNSDGSFGYTPDPGYTGNDGFTYEASDGEFSSGLAIVSLTVLNADEPSASDDSYSLDQDSTLIVDAISGVLANDSDPQNDPMTAVLETGTANGLLALSADGSFTYDPNPGFFGTDSFTYRADEGDNVSNVATVTLTVNSLAQPLQAQWLFEEGTGSVANDTSGSGYTGNVLGAEWVTDTPSGSGFSLSFDGVDDYVDVGEVGVVGEALTIALWFKADSFAASDGRLISRATGSSSRKHHWMLSTTSSAGTKLRFRLRTDGSTSTLIASSGNLVPGVWTHAAIVYDGATMRIYKDGVEVGSLPKTGMLANDPGVLTAIGNQPSGAGSAPFHGAIDVVRIYQQALTESELAALVSGDNQPPVAANDAYVLDQDTPLALDAGSGVLANDTDPDSDPLSAVLVGDVAFGTLVLNTAGSFEYTPDPGFAGEDGFTYQASDGEFLSALATVSLTVQSDDEPLALDDSYSLEQDSTLVVDSVSGVLANDSDPQNDPMTAVLVTGTSDGALALFADGSLTFTPNPGFVGIDSFTYRADEGDALSNVATVTLTVNPANQAPDSSIDSPPGAVAILAGEAVNFEGSGSDADATIPLSYAWDFDEGSSGIPPVSLEDPGPIVFATPGLYTVSLTVSDAAPLADPTPASVRVLVQAAPMLVDNEDLEFAAAGPWQSSASPPEYVGSDYLEIAAGTGTNTATWSFTVPSAGIYAISAQWVADPDNATDVGFTIYSDGIELGTVAVDQTRLGGALNLLDLFDLSGGTLEVVLSDDANGSVIADAVEVSESAFRITGPASGSVVTAEDVPVTMQTLGLLPEWGVEFVVDSDAASAVQTYTQPFGTVLSELSLADHTVEAFAIDAVGVRISGLTASALFSTGTYLVAFGGGLAEGLGDDILEDNASLDGRNDHTGFAPILNDLLTASQGHPHTVETEGLDQSLAADEVSRVAGVLAGHPEAQALLILVGLADALDEATPSGLGISSGDPGYAGSYKDSMSQIAAAVLDSGREPLISKLSMCVGDYSGSPFPDPGTAPLNLLLQEYNQAIDELVAELSLNSGPDLYSHFEANPDQLFDDCFPNGVGYQSIADLWLAALPDVIVGTPAMAITAAFADCGTGSSGNVASCGVPYPPGVVAGDELLIWLAIDSNPDDMACSNFEHLTQQGTSVGLAVFRRTATAAHTGTENCTWDAGDPQSGGVIMTRVTGAARLRPPLASFDSAASTTSNPPAIPIPVADTLVVTACAHDGGGGVSSDPPAGYAELLDGAGCVGSGCVNTSIATRTVTETGFEAPGPFTSWSTSDETACITLGYDNGTATEPIFSINWDDTSSPESCKAEGAIQEQGANDCNCSSGNCPLPQGGESLSMPTQTDGQKKTIGYSPVYGAMAGVSTGCVIVDFEVNFDTFSTTKNTSFFELTSGNQNSGGEIRYLNSGDRLGIRCDGNVKGSFNYSLVEDENYKIRMEYCIDEGPGLCAGNAPGCENCGCLYVETAASGNPYGTTQIDACDGSTLATIPIDGWHFSMSASTLDLLADDLAVCEDNPAPGDKCGW